MCEKSFCYTTLVQLNTSTELHDLLVNLPCELKVLFVQKLLSIQQQQKKLIYRTENLELWFGKFSLIFDYLFIYFFNFVGKW